LRKILIIRHIREVEEEKVSEGKAYRKGSIRAQWDWRIKSREVKKDESICPRKGTKHEGREGRS